MNVIDKEMYHIHIIGNYDEIWQENNEIEVDNNYNSLFISKIIDIPAGVMMKDGNRSVLHKYIKKIIEQIDTEQKILELAKLSEEELIKKGICLHQILWDSYVRLFNLSLKNREEALEEVRQEKYPNLPSRYHSIWVCDESQLGFWKEQLQIESIVLKLLLNGNLFKSSDMFLPNDGDYKEQQKKDAYKYWEPIFNTPEEEAKAEYLFQGKVKILQRI